MKINKQTLRQIIKEELQTVLEQESAFSTYSKNLKSLKKKYNAGQIDKDKYDRISRQLTQSYKEKSDLEDADLDKMDTLAGATAAPDSSGEPDLDSFDTLAGATAAPEQDAEQIATKYAKVKQILANLVKEL